MPENIVRHKFKATDVADAMLPNGMVDCKRLDIHAAGGVLFVDIVEPVKGGARAKRAGILCNSKAFLTFLEVGNADAAKESIYSICSVKSRRDLDHNDDAGKLFDELAKEFDDWMREPG